MKASIAQGIALTSLLLAHAACGDGLLTSGDPAGDVDSGAGAGPDAGPYAPDANLSSPPDADVDTGADANLPSPPDASTPVEPDAGPQTIDCSGIAADPAYELCESDDTQCAGVFTDGSGCVAYCAAAGLVCAGRFGGEPGCNKEPATVLSCSESNGHASDWCVCEAPGGGGGGDCTTEPGNPPVAMEISKDAATYTKRHNWVLGCYSYAFTGAGSEHQACDSQYSPDGTRTGKATFTFAAVPPGSYDVTIYSRHTENRNSAGALFYVDGHPKIINQRDDADYVWDFHGTYCLDGSVDVVLDSSVNSGSDSVQTVRLTPTP